MNSSRFQNINDLREVLGERAEPANSPAERWSTITRDLSNIELPDEFDARKVWPHCKTISKIRDQSRCGSCWAFATTGVMSDRLCIHSNGTVNVDLSVRDVVSCCDYCGAGCDGGYSRRAWDYWITKGIVTGGTYEDKEGCQPYPFPACSREPNPNLFPPCPREPYDTPECQQTCVQGYNGTYEKDKYFGKSFYYVATDEKQIRQEILLNGPVQASMSVFADFANYHSGIYHHTVHYYVGSHAIRIVGWGEQYGVPYWIVANSWNTDWGEDGFFRILRGKDECAIETSVQAGLPQIRRLSDFH
ncbi:unnamed protein product [Echinostoma caproni]|uniref:Cathepsin B-like cysteine proteinase n=1 Tax=Echinostoma caproni TaxID=27848 RepID=A0A3P8L0F4_9TREM|nr:unnamed protein product [Echinostoma caproni]